MSAAAEVSVKRRGLWIGVVLAGCLWMAAAPVSGQTSFNPVITFGAFYTNNFNFIGESGGDKTSDGYYLGLSLPVARQTSFGSVTAMYSTNYEDFNDVELNNGRHLFNFTYNNIKNRDYKIRSHLRYNLTQDQGSRRALAENQLFLSPRADREFADFGINVGRKLGPFWGLRLLGRFSTWRYGQFVGIEEEGVVPRGFRDRDAYRIGVGASRIFNRSYRLGMAYAYRRFELANFGEQNVHSLSATFSYNVGRSFRLGIAAGGFSRETTATNGETRDKSGFQMNIALGKAWRLRTFILGFRLGHAPNVGGGAQVGTATVTRIGVYMRPGTSSGRRNWSWSLYGNWAQRDPVAEIQPNIESVSAGGSIFYNLGRVLGISLSTFWVDQDSEAVRNRGDFIRFNLGLIIRPFGATRMAAP